MLLIDGERSANYKEAPQRGTVSHVWYDSGILGINRRMTVYLPYGYEDNPDKRYPVLYLLHGAGGDEEAWISMGGGHTTTAAIMYPGTFDYICPMSSGLRAYDDIDKDLQGIKKAGYKLFFVGCGTADNLAYASSQNLDAALTRNGMEHINCFTPGGHTWSNWRFYLNTIGKLLFK